MIQIEYQYQNAVKRDGIYDLFEKSLKKHAFVDREKALNYRIKKKKAEEVRADRENELDDEINQWNDEKPMKSTQEQIEQFEAKS